MRKPAGCGTKGEDAKDGDAEGAGELFQVTNLKNTLKRTPKKSIFNLMSQLTSMSKNL